LSIERVSTPFIMTESKNLKLRLPSTSDQSLRHLPISLIFPHAILQTMRGIGPHYHCDCFPSQLRATREARPSLSGPPVCQETVHPIRSRYHGEALCQICKDWRRCSLIRPRCRSEFRWHCDCEPRGRGLRVPVPRHRRRTDLAVGI